MLNIPNLFKKKLSFLTSFLVILAVFSLASFLTPQPAHAATLLFNGNFESGTISGWACSGNCPTVVTSPTRAGKFSVRSFLDANTSKVSYRTELVNRAVSDFSFGKEYWVGLSFYLPPDWSDKYISGYDQGMLWQFHDRGFNDPSWRGGLPLVLNHFGGKFIIQRRGHPSSKKFWEAPYVKGKWVDWVINVKWSKGSDGFINIWRDGQQIVSDRGANYYPEHGNPPYFKMGLYQWGWDEGVPLGTTQRTVYHDEVRVAQGSNGYSLVAPSGSPPIGGPPPGSSTPTPAPTATPALTPTPSPAPTAAPGCQLSKSSWQNFSIAPQTGSFSVEFDATPQSADTSSLTMLSSGSGAAYTDYAVLMRFNKGIIEARNGSSYQAQTQINFEPGTTYHFRLTINIPVNSYSVYVTPQGGSEQTIGTNFAFRTEQSGVTVLDNWGLHTEAGSHQVCNFTLASPSLPGDIDGDNDVDIFDYNILASNFGSTNCGNQADIDGDCDVDIFDYNILVGNFGK